MVPPETWTFFEPAAACFRIAKDPEGRWGAGLPGGVAQGDDNGDADGEGEATVTAFDEDEVAGEAPAVPDLAARAAVAAAETDTGAFFFAEADEDDDGAKEITLVRGAPAPTERAAEADEGLALADEIPQSLVVVVPNVTEWVGAVLVEEEDAATVDVPPTFLLVLLIVVVDVVVIVDMVVVVVDGGCTTLTFSVEESWEIDAILTRLETSVDPPPPELLLPVLEAAPPRVKAATAAAGWAIFLGCLRGELGQDCVARNGFLSMIAAFKAADAGSFAPSLAIWPGNDVKDASDEMEVTESVRCGFAAR